MTWLKPWPGRGPLALLLAYCLVTSPFARSSQQQKQQQEQQHHPISLHNHQVGAEGIPQSLEYDITLQPVGAVGVDFQDRNYKRVKDTNVDSNDPSALQTFAPAGQYNGNVAVRAPSPAGKVGRSDSARSSSLHHARSLQDWEVEDIILLATVDGSIYARDRRTGRHKWGPILTNSPVVETIYHRDNTSGLRYQYDDALNDFLWIVEPVQDGDIYLYNKAQHGILQKLRMTVKTLQERTPYASEDPAVVYIANKTTALMTFDAATGEWRRTYGSGRSKINDKTTCRLEGFGGYQEQECGLMGTLTLGRVTYTIEIEHRLTAEPICTLVYSEWVPNTRDGDLHMQYNSSMDHSYVYPQHDGTVLALKHGLSNSKSPDPLWRQKLPSPVIRVFDIAKPVDSDSLNTELVVLTQPVARTNVDSWSESDFNMNKVFVNHTTAGGWYALSEQMYPTITSGVDRAQCYDDSWRSHPIQSESLNQTELKKVLIGVHPLVGIPESSPNSPLIDNPVPPVESNLNLPAAPVRDGYYVSKTMVNALLTFSTLFAAFIGFCVFYLDRSKLLDFLRKQFAPNLQIPVPQTVQSGTSSPITANFPKTEPNEEFELAQEEATSYDAETSEKDHDPRNEVYVTAQLSAPTETSVEPISDPNIETTKEALAEPDLNDLATKQLKAHVRILESSTVQDNENDGDPSMQDSSLEKDKKKARRGTRGGKAHRRKKKGGSKGENETDPIVLAPPDSDELAVEKALEINNEPKTLEPDAVTVIPSGSDPTKVNDTTLQIGQLTVLEDKVLGFGSHGTRVFRGTFGGRDVAVKCMLKQLYDIAAHEVTVLQESDDHPNVIRYFMMESAGDFMYIALELCPASLAEVVDRPLDYLELTGTGGLDMVDALRQITMGIRYLHSLKIVHRDIKPENILMAAPKRIPTRSDFVQRARLLISDFGLCKKLELDQSSFRATTAHAAGTSGWRAPELLVDDEEGENMNKPEAGSGTEYSTTSEPVIVDTSTNRRVTRAIDIFALGCVFYYVLSKGNHPFDGKGRGEGKYMREANIIRGNHMLDDLSVLGAYQGEADNLISRMLAKRPKDRPDAGQVLSHPFFWSATDRLDFLCHVSDQFEFEPRDPPSFELQLLESVAPEVIQDCRGDFLKKLPADFVATLGKQRKYKGDHMLDLLRAMRNKKNHYEDMPDSVKARVGSLPEGYLIFWTERFPKLLMKCHQVVQECGWEDRDRFRKYYSIV